MLPDPALIEKAVALLDPTPLDVLFYGADKQGLDSWHRMEFWAGVRRIFGLYRAEPTAASAADAAKQAADGAHPPFHDPAAASALRSVSTYARVSFAAASILAELSAHGLVERAWSTVVYDGELGELPVYLVAPGEDASTLAYAKQVLGDGPAASRFARFLAA